MARYIDADAVISQIESSTAETWGKGLGRAWWSHAVMLKDNIVQLIRRTPTADVAPRAEVAREIILEIEKEITDALKSNYKVLPLIEESEALWNNVNGKINALRGIEYFIDELKKKYTEDKT